MLSSPVSAKLQPRAVRPAHHDVRVALSRFVLLPIPAIQTLSFQTLTDSFVQRRSHNSFLFNRFRTLSIAMGVYTPLKQNVFQQDVARTLEIRPSWKPWFSFLTFHGSRELCAPLAQKERTNCALLRNKPFACHTCAFLGGRREGVLLLTTFLTTSEGQTAGRCWVWRSMSWRAASDDISGLSLRAVCAPD
jgi:hypothetical protein